ncbi:restriction endonuclease fold toxin-2 domain-containing protein [Streptomyces lydicus]|uniref:restriction endonuclease fold toxin-2 domain-containing protein n=1 Tax=Streptomyces lydicus TaxID=47763 RepID=UPI0036BEAA11
MADWHVHVAGLMRDLGGGGDAVFYRVHAVDLIDSSWGMHTLNEELVESVLALVRELSEQAGMVGDDDAGEVFANVYKSAAKTTVNQIGEAAHAMGRGSDAVLQTANNYMAAESAAAKAMLKAMGKSGAAGPPTGRSGNCTPAPRRRGEELEEVVGETSTATKWLLGDRFRGDPDKLRSVAATWRKVRTITERVHTEAQDCWLQAKRNHEGKTAEAIDRFFTKFVGWETAPSQTDGSCTLMANLPAACQQIANACDRYADHIETAHKTALDDASDPFGETSWQMPWEKPAFGGNGYDGGLMNAVVSDGRITQLASLAHNLDASQARVPVPGPKPDIDAPMPGIPPFIRVPAPILVPAAYFPPDPSVPRGQPIPPPNPPDPRFPPLSAQERAGFTHWASGLRDGGFSNGRDITDPDNAYQHRICGYPEKELPIKPGISKHGTQIADGLRASDGMAVDAKHVRDPGCSKTFRSLDKLAKADDFQKRVLFRDDTDELKKYKSAMEYGPNKGQIRGLEIVTNDQSTVPYWDAMMAAQGVKGYARYAP